MSSKSKGKRRAEAPAQPPPAKGATSDDDEELEFEDEYGDDYEEEEFVQGDDDDDDDEDEDGDAEGGAVGGSSKPSKREARLVAMEEAEAADGVNVEAAGRLWRAGDAIPEGEKLDYDSSAYDMLHRLNMEWPCLTFAFAHDNLGEQRTKFPMTAYAVAGTQAESASQDRIVCAKMSQLAKTRHDEDSESDDDDSDDEADVDPIVEVQMVPHEGSVNRLKLMPQANSSHICATWSSTGKVHIYDLSAPLANLAAPGSANPQSLERAQRPAFTFSGHTDEGFALDFSMAKPGALASADCASALHVWQPREGGSWAVDPEPYRGHTASVEDVAWSPVEANVLMSCGCDSTVRVWDVRRKGGSALTVDEGHGQDVNVISWNKTVNYLVVTGCDDGSFRVWDLRSFSGGEPVAKFHWHRAAITSVEWSPLESSSLAVTGEDHQLTLWDLALESDPDAEAAHVGRDDLADLPPQLYFVHQGQRDIKEVHWHKQLPGVLGSTAGDSFHIFKPANSGDGATEA
jgi:ribosome assembly protein RRB1